MGQNRKNRLEGIQVPVRAHILVSGRVQGVFFRSQTQDEALRLSITGWVRNLEDGRVEAVFEGKANVDALVDFCRKGPFGARVTKVDLMWENVTGEFKTFSIRHAL